VELALKIWWEHLYKKLERKIDIAGFFFWVIVIVGLALEIPDAANADRETSFANRQFAALTEKTLELAHQYDLSTNALAEANARLAAIRPLKERIIGWCNEVDPRILVALNAGQTTFNAEILAPDVAVLRSLQIEPGAVKYILWVKFGNERNVNVTRVDSRGQHIALQIALSPELAK
jgi:hypothetical protein